MNGNVHRCEYSAWKPGTRTQRSKEKKAPASNFRIRWESARSERPTRRYTTFGLMRSMAGYSGTPLWKKLGYKNGNQTYVEGAPTTYATILGLPADVSVHWEKRIRNGLNFAHIFATSKAKLQQKLLSLRKTIDPAGVIWVSWPKKSSGIVTDITENVVRDIALPLGLVDIKVCAVDEIWSGLKLMIRKKLRSK